MTSRRICKWREGEVFSVVEKAGECGLDAASLRRAILEIRAALGRAKSLPFGVKIDTPRPDVRGDRAFGGFWVGVIDVGEGLRVVVEPRVERYGEMLSTVREVLGVSTELYITALGTLTASQPLALFTNAMRLLHEAYLVAWREPKYVLQYLMSRQGRIEVEDGRLVAYKHKRVLNTPLINSVLAALRRAVSAVEEISQEVREYGEVAKVVEMYLTSVRQACEVVAAELGDLAMWADGDNFGKYWYLAAWTPRGAATGEEGLEVKFVAVPSTKLYELYVYSLFVKALGGGRAECPREKFCLQTGRYKVYFNRAPISRFVRVISGRRPHPDAAVLGPKGVAVVEAKYRELNDGKLPLPDSLRLLAYLADVAKNEKLRAYLAALKAPHGEVKTAVIEGRGGKVEVEVRYLSLRPGDAAGLATALKDLF